MNEGTPTIQEFDELKKEFASAKSFSDFWERFMDNWADRRSFIDMGVATDNPQLMKIIVMTCSRIVGKPVELQMPMLVSIPEANMIHGAYFVAGTMGSILYFEDIGMGLVVLALVNGRTEYARFGMTMTKAPVQ